MFVEELVYIGFNNEDSHIRTRPLPLADGSPLLSWIYTRDSWADSDLPGTFPLACYI
jgi:hypothetical protein